MSLFRRVTLPLAGVNFANQASRGMVALLGPALALEFGLSASELGFLAGLFFAAYALTQLPVGVAIDMFGPRRVQTALCALAALGFALSGLAEGPALLGLGRFITGIGVAAGLIAILKAHTQWLPRGKVAAATGLAVFLGALGGLSATAPLQAILPLIGWRGGFLLMAGVAAAISAWVWLSVPEIEREAGRPRRGLLQEIAQYGPIFAHPVFLRWLPSICLLSAMNFSYQGLWAGPWLRDVAGAEGMGRAVLLLIYAAGLMTGSLATGQAASRLQARGLPPMLVPVLAMALMGAMQALLILRPTLDHAALGAMWFLFSFSAGAGPIAYSVVGQSFPAELAGRVATAINASMLASVVVIQNGVGWVLDLWPRDAAGGWHPQGYAWAMGITLAAQILAGLWAWRARAR